MTDDLTSLITAALDRAEQRAKAAMWSEAMEAAEWTFQPALLPYEHPIVADGLGDGVVIVRPENADIEGVGKHIEQWDPQAVLDLISAHREILEFAHMLDINYSATDADDLRALLAKAHRIEVPDER